MKSNPASCSIGNPHSCMSYEIWQVDQKMTAFSLCLFQRWKQLGGLRSARQRSHHCHSPLRSFMVSWFQVQKSSVSQCGSTCPGSGPLHQWCWGLSLLLGLAMWRWQNADKIMTKLIKKMIERCLECHESSGFAMFSYVLLSIQLEDA